MPKTEKSFSGMRRWSVRLNTTLMLLLALASLFSLPAAFLHAQDHSEPDLIPKKQQSPEETPKSDSNKAAPQEGQLESAPSSGSSSVSGKAESEPFPMSLIVIAMLIGGFILLMIEVAIIPGFGLAGIKGALLIFIGLALAYWQLDSRTAIIYTVISFLALIGLGLWFIFIFPHTAIGKKFILDTKISVADGYTATEDFSRFVGREGVATSDLRPSGIARLGDERVDVMSEGDFIPRGSKIKAIRVKNGNVIVISLEPPKLA